MKSSQQSTPSLKKISLIGGACSGGLALSLSGAVVNISIGELPSILTGGLDYNDGTATWNIDGVGSAEMYIRGQNYESSFVGGNHDIVLGRNGANRGWNSAGAIDPEASFVINAASFANNFSMQVKWASAAQENVIRNDFTSFSSTDVKTAQFQFNDGASVGWIYILVNDPSNPTLITAVEVNGKAGQWGQSGDTFDSAVIPEPSEAAGALGLLAAGAAAARHLRRGKRDAA